MLVFSAIRCAIFCSLVACLSGMPWAAAAQVPSSTVEVLVLGSPHLRQRPADAMPIDVELIRRSLISYRPDQVVIEWLHPSLDAATTFNYVPLGDASTLARLWGYRLASVGPLVDSLRLLVRQRGPSSLPPRVGAHARRELGRLLYLQRDETNAAYQWFLARAAGAPDPEAERLVVRLLAGHEGVEWGFAVAAALGLEEITAFDYQGPDAGTLVWGEMLGAIRDTALRRVGGVSPDDSTAMRSARAEYDSLRNRFESTGDTAWLARFGASPGVRQYATVVRGFASAEAATPGEVDGRTLMRWLQSSAYAALERRVQDTLIPSIAFQGFGARRRAGILGRNQHMVEFLLRDAARLRSQRILVVVGASHKFELEALLRQRGMRVLESSRFIP